MKKLLILLVVFVFTCINLYSENLDVRVIIKSMNVISPDGETKTYVEPRSVPPIDYASTIIANGMSILNYHSVGIVLKNQQGIFISKDPITNILMFSKVENTRSGPIIVSFNATTIAQIDADTIFSLHYEPKDNCIKLKLICEYDNDCDLLNADALKQYGYKDSSLQKHNCKNIPLIEYIAECFSYKESIDNTPKSFKEGLRHSYLTTIYDRSRDARRGFLDKQNKPYKCCVCGMDFESIYGERGKGFIHVHHKDPLGGETDERDTRFEDLAMVCPNCHAMLHRGNDLLEPDELKNIIEKNRKEKT